MYLLFSIAAAVLIVTGLIASILALAVDKWGQFENEILTGQKVKVSCLVLHQQCLNQNYSIGYVTILGS